MHIWPSLMVRDSFKLSYLKKLDWNLHRMKSQKESPTNRKKLLDSEGDVAVVDANDGKEVEVVIGPTDSRTSKALVLCREILMILSCCYCCFCCGACVGQEEN